MKTKSVRRDKASGALTNNANCFNMGSNKMVLGQHNVEVLDINYAKREIRMLVHTHFTPNEIKTDTSALAAVERQRDAACHYLTQEGFLQQGDKPCPSDAQWCVRAGVIHDRPHDKDRIHRLPS